MENTLLKQEELFLWTTVRDRIQKLREYYLCFGANETEKDPSLKSRILDLETIGNTTTRIMEHLLPEVYPEIAPFFDMKTTNRSDLLTLKEEKEGEKGCETISPSVKEGIFYDNKPNKY